MTQQNQNPNPTSKVDDDEIDLIALAKTLWSGRKTVIKTTLIFMAIGLFVAVFSKKEFKASTMFIPQTKESNKIGGNLGGLAALAGINLGSLSGDSGISPELYPQILNSIPFQLELLQTPLTFEGQSQKITYEDYYINISTPGLLGYIKKYTIGLPGLIIKAIKGKPTKSQQLSTDNQLLTITREEGELIKQLNNQLILEVDDKDGYVTISGIMPEAVPAAELAYSAEELLQKYIINFKIKKSKEQLAFIQARYFEKKEWFNEVQNKLASFRDRNQNLNTSLAQSKLEILESEYELAFGLYSELAKQWETQQIQVTENTPVFTVIKPVTIPLEKSKPKRFSILFIYSFMGGFIGVAFVFLKTQIVHLKRKMILKNSQF